jgi:hypothetical protein
MIVDVGLKYKCRLEEWYDTYCSSKRQFIPPSCEENLSHHFNYAMALVLRYPLWLVTCRSTPLPVDEDVVAVICQMLRPTERLLEIFLKGETWTHVLRYCLENAILSVVRVLRFCDAAGVEIPKAIHCLDKIFLFDQNSLQISDKVKPYIAYYRKRSDSL